MPSPWLRSAAGRSRLPGAPAAVERGGFCLPKRPPQPGARRVIHGFIGQGRGQAVAQRPFEPVGLLAAAGHERHSACRAERTSRTIEALPGQAARDKCRHLRPARQDSALSRSGEPDAQRPRCVRQAPTAADARRERAKYVGLVLNRFRYSRRT